MITEFRPAIRFVLRFLLVYFSGNVIYGLFIEYFSPSVDPFTHLVSDQSAFLLRLFDNHVTAVANQEIPTVSIWLGNYSVISVYEGCNGLNVIIIYLAFLVAYGGDVRKLLWFIPAGVLIIYIANLTRIVLLYFIALEYPDLMFFTHKYLFTTSIYLIVIVLWFWWFRISVR